MKKQVSIRNKLVLYYMSIGIITVLIISGFFYLTFKNTLIKRTLSQLESVSILKKKQIENYLQNENNINILFHNPVFSEALSLSASHDKPLYVKRDSILDEKINQLLEEQHYKELIILNNSDSVIYYTSKSNHDVTRLFLSKQKKIYIKTFISKCKNATSFIDLTNITSNNITLLLGTPIYNHYGQIKGIAILEKNLDFVESILTETTGMGNTGETYIVGGDYTMRSKSRFITNVLPSTIAVKTQATINGLKNIDGKGIFNDYRNVEVMSVYDKLNLKGINWVIISEIDLQIAMQPIYKSLNEILIIGILIALLIALLTLYISNKIVKPIITLEGIVLKLSKGILPQQSLIINTNDEIGQITSAINELAQALKLTSAFANEIGKGNFTFNYTPLSETDELGNALIQMRNNLITLNTEIQSLIKQRSFALISGQDAERKRIARELHDGIGQMLTAIRLKVNAINGDEEQCKELKQMIDSTTTEVKRISKNLMPGVLLDLGLTAAIKELIKSTNKISSVKIEYTHPESDNDDSIGFEYKLTIYRIIQEALNNCIKHSNATIFSIKLTITLSEITLTIVDNGTNAKIPNINLISSGGLFNMKERVELMGGTFTINTINNSGTQLVIAIPIKQNL